MITLDLDRIIKLRAIARPHTHLLEAGFSSHTAHNLLNGTKKTIDFAHLEKLCNLFQCTPNDLLRWEPAKGTEAVKEGHHLAPLQRIGPATIPTLAHLVHTLPHEKLEKLQQMINKLEKEA